MQNLFDDILFFFFFFFLFISIDISWELPAYLWIKCKKKKKIINILSATFVIGTLRVIQFYKEESFRIPKPMKWMKIADLVLFILSLTKPQAKVDIKSSPESNP